MDVSGRCYHEEASDKSAATVWRYQANMGQNLWGLFPAPCAMKNESSSEGKTQDVLNKGYWYGNGFHYWSYSFYVYALVKIQFCSGVEI